MNKETLKKYTPAIITSIIIITIIIIVIATHRKQEKTAIVIPTADTLTTTTGTPTTPAPVVPKTTQPSTKPTSGLTTTIIAPQLHFVSQTSTASGDESIKHGVFTIDFSINAAEKDLYVSPTCTTTTSKDGVSFNLIKDGISTNDGLGSASCAIINVSGASLQKSGRFMIPAFTVGTLKMIVTAHPSLNGSYKMRINQIGYALSDSTGTTTLSMDSALRDQMQTNTTSL